MLDGNQREHTRSYYAASQRDKDPFPALKGDVTADVCIVGGGLSGVATAVELSERGYKVALLEANRIGWGASGRNGGQIIGGFGGSLAWDIDKTERKLGPEKTQAIIDMSIECVDIIRERIAKYNIECDLRWGFLDVALKEREMRDLEHSYEKKKQQNYPSALRLLNRQEIKAFLGTDRYIGGLVNEGWGHLHVLDLCKAQARIAETLGAEIYEHSLVTSIEYGERVCVKGANGNVTAKTVVLCGNAYMAQLSPTLAPKLSPYILPATSYIIATNPLSDNLAKSVMPQNYAVCDQRTALDYFRLSADNRMLFGGVSNYTAKPPRSVGGTLRRKMLKVFPQLHDVKIDYQWGGHMGISFKRALQMGQLDTNIYYVQAYSGHGVAPTHMSARLLAEAISGDRDRFDIIANVERIPFPGTGFIRQSMFALGMSFYKMRDAIP